MNTRWKYILLAAYAFLVVVVGVYLLVSTYFHIPLVSLLPSLPFMKSAPVASPTPGIKPTSVQRFTSTNGVVSYAVRGKFVTNPTYNALNVLQSDFVIDEDPSSHRIPVVMTIKTGKINVGRSQGSLQGTTVWKLEDTESLRQSINVNAPAQIRLQPVSPELSAYDLSVQTTMDSIITGNWSIPGDFVLHPPMVGVLQ